MRYTAQMLCSVLLLLLPLSGLAQTTSGDSAVWSLLATQEQASGRFLQELYGEDGELLERSSGRYAVLRPGFFRWEIDYPDRQQIVIAGDSLWHYDLDLATASQRRIGDDEQFTALDLLARDSDDLAARFSVEEAGDGRFRLVPLFPQAGFASAELRWDGNELVAMDVVDRSGQELRITLTPDTEAQPLTPGDFDFEAPDGVDVHRALDR